MAFSDPQNLRALTSIVDGAIMATLPRTTSAQDLGQFKNPDQTQSLSVSHQYAKRIRRVVRLDAKAIVTDPLLAGVSTLQSMSVYLVVDSPQSGFDRDDQKSYVEALTQWLAGDNFGNTFKFLGGES